MKQSSRSIDPAPTRQWRLFYWLGAIGFLTALTALFGGLTGTRGGVEVRTDSAGQQRVIVHQDRSGHYLAKGALNGQPVRFLIDTGATSVAVPEPLARQLGLDFGPEIPILTAGGMVTGWMTRIDSVTIGPLQLKNVSGTITEGPLTETLLGMSFLKYFRLTQDGNELVIESDV